MASMAKHGGFWGLKGVGEGRDAGSGFPSLPGGCADWCGGAGSENDVPWLNL